MTTIAFFGLGNMGSGMCANLVAAGHRVQAYDLSVDAVAAAAAGGAVAAHTVADAMREAEVVVTMLPAGKHVLSAYFDAGGIASHAADGTLFIDCSTIAVEDARAAISKASEAGFDMVDAPVSGGVAAAAGGTLTFMVGGSDGGFARAQTILKYMGKTIVHAGGAGNGQAAKIANNMLLAVSMIATCEAFDLAQRLGLETQTFFDIASKASGQNWSMTSYCPAPGPVPSAPSNNGYKAGFAVDMMLKDLRLAAEAAGTVEAEATFGRLAKEVYERLSEDGSGGMDFSVVMKQLSERS